ncbi:MAG TPA: hypothetical protein PLQ15_09400 [Syntrophales bacterium]|nr:hypothetical protein [Syntrophobacterales bacterium]HQL90804.1 hypothetical protein [Syntrophales bacterium]
MERDDRKTQDEPRILTHEPVEGWRPVFFVLVALGVGYLAVVLAKTL